MNTISNKKTGDGPEAIFRSKGCVGRLYKDAIRRMGYKKRIEEEKSRTLCPTLRPSTSINMIKTDKNQLKRSVVLSSYQSRRTSDSQKATNFAHSRSKSFVQYRTMYRASNEAIMTEKSNTHGLLLAMKESYRGVGSASALSKKNSKMKQMLREKQSESAKKISNKITDLEMIFNMSPNKQNTQRLESARKLNSNSIKKKNSSPNKQRGERSKRLEKYRTILMGGNKMESQHGRAMDTCLTKASQARGDVDLFDVVDE